MDNARLEKLANDVIAAVVASSPTVQMMARELLEARERLARIDEILASAEAVYVNILRGNLPMTKQNAIALAVRFGGLPDDVEARLAAYEALKVDELIGPPTKAKKGGNTWQLTRERGQYFFRRQWCARFLKGVRRKLGA